MEIPSDFSNPFYGHLKADILNVLTGPLASLNLSEEAALRKISQHCGAEKGYSEDLVRSLPQWKSRFFTSQPAVTETVKQLDPVTPPTPERLPEPEKTPEVVDPKNDDKQPYQGNK